MEPITIVIICAVVFGVTAGLCFFVRQLLLSRDKKLNDQALRKALAQEAQELEKLRIEMTSNKRFGAHYQVLGSNKESIQYIDQKIADTFEKKSALIDHYAQVALRESAAIISGEEASARKAVCDRLKEEVDSQLKLYDIEIGQLQTRRSNLWDTHSGLQEHLLQQEKQRNEQLDAIYVQHSVMLEKIYARHDESSENMVKQSMESSNQSYRSIFSAPMDFLSKFFKLSSGVSPLVAPNEIRSRKAIRDMERIINEDGVMDESEEFLESTGSQGRPAFTW